MIPFVQKMADRLRQMAKQDHAAYPQYAGYFDQWVMASAKREVRYKGGSRLSAGRWVLASPDMTSWYDPDNGHICGVSAGDLVNLV